MVLAADNGDCLLDYATIVHRGRELRSAFAN